MTPVKIYDPNNEFDEEYFEFGLYMSRREYKTITKRLQRGRVAGAKEGKFVGSTPTYGYDKVKLKGEKGYALVINEEEAKVIRFIFNLFLHHRLGGTAIARHLDSLGIKTRRGNNWSASTIHDILVNPHYIGMIKFNNRVTVKRIINGTITTSRHKHADQEVVYVKGRHEAIISEEMFNQVQELRRQRYIPRKTTDLALANPLSGIVLCKKCGRTMVRGWCRDKRRLYCKNPYCDNIGSFLDDIEEKILSFLEMWLKDVELVLPKTNLKEDMTLKQDLLKSKEKYLKSCKDKLNRVYDLFEEQVYDKNTFLTRSNKLNEDINNTLEEIKTLKDEIKNMENIKIDNEQFIPNLKYVLENYKKTEDIELKNQLLKTVIDKVYYQKDTMGNKWNKATFELWVLPKINSVL